MPKTCSIEGCNEAHIARSWCSSHYQRWRAHGDPLGGRTRQFCGVDGCGKPAHGYGWCHAHYMKWRKYGDPLWVRPAFDSCTVEGCDKEPRSPTADLCDMHYCRRWRTGSIHGAGSRRAETPGYRAAHGRITADRGKASAHPCVDCGEQGAHWSFSWRRTPIEHWLWGSIGRATCVYTARVEDYDPRCRSCAVEYDRGFAAEGWRQLVQVTARDQPGGFNART
jgi:hypothetical protein